MIPSLLTFAYTSFLLLTSVAAQKQCNGYTEFCDRSYGNVTFIGAHNSAFVSAAQALSANQHFDVTRQLDDGIRLLQSQGHKPPTGETVAGGIELCHTTCDLLDAGPLMQYLQKVKSWLDANADEVVTILFTNPDGLDISIWDDNFSNAGLADLAYVPSFTTTPADTLTWPTIGSILDSGKRIVVFLDAGADQTKVPYILPEFTYIWENPFDQTDNSFPCNVDRPPNLKGQVPTGRMSVINHFLDTELTKGVLIPDTGALNVTNAEEGVGSLGVQAETCSALYGRYPNFVLVDYYDVSNGSVFKVAATLNGVTYVPSKTFQESTPSASNSVPGLPSDADAKKVLPVFVILQLLFSALIVVGAFWLAWDSNIEKQTREDRFTTFFPAKLKKHQKYDSVASIGSDAGFAVELETGMGRLRGHRPTDSTADLASHAALMGSDSPRQSLESLHLGGDEDVDSLRRVLDTPKPSGGYLEHRRNTLFM